MLPPNSLSALARRGISPSRPRNPATTRGLDWLIGQRKKWYELREQVRGLKAGDLVAVLGKGIGIVESADSDDVHVLMWNKLTLRMPRKKVVGNGQNYRWESDATETFCRRMPLGHGTAAG
jgi:hypothetical protein